LCVNVDNFSPSEIPDLLEKAEDLRLMNDRFCELEEIFHILDGLEELEAESNAKSRPPERTSTSEGAPVPGSLLQPQSHVENLAIKEESFLLETPNLMTGEQPSEVDHLGQIQNTEAPGLHISQLVGEASSLIRIVVELETLPQELRLGFKIEQYRLELWVESFLLLANSRDVSYWKPFEDVLLPVIHVLKSLRDEYVIKRSLLSKLVLPSVVEKHVFGKILKSLCYGNDCLDTMTVNLRQGSLRRSLRAHFSTALARDTEHQLQKAAALLGHVDIEHLAQAMEIVNKANGEPPPPHSTFHPEQDLVIERTNIDFPQVESWSGERRQIVQYNGSNIVMDWQYHNDSDGWREMNPIVFRHRREILARLLNHDLQAMGLSVLQCVGYVKSDPDLTGYGFRLPQEVSPKDNPVTLNDLLEQPTGKSRLELPDLAERFDLAKALVNTMFEIHTIGWIHGNLLARNILFWPHKDNSQRYEITKPYLISFDIAGPSGRREFSERPATRIDDDSHQHRDYQRAAARQHVSDLYSLGIVLFKIGFWHPIGSLFEEKRGKDFYNSSLVPDMLRNKAKTLRFYAGNRYVEAALACVDGRLKDMCNKYESEGQRENYLKYFGSKIVDVIATCNA